MIRKNLQNEIYNHSRQINDHLLQIALQMQIFMV